MSGNRLVIVIVIAALAIYFLYYKKSTGKRTEPGAGRGASSGFGAMGAAFGGA